MNKLSRIHQLRIFYDPKLEKFYYVYNKKRVYINHGRQQVPSLRVGKRGVMQMKKNPKTQERVRKGRQSRLAPQKQEKIKNDLLHEFIIQNLRKKAQNNLEKTQQIIQQKEQKIEKKLEKYKDDPVKLQQYKEKKERQMQEINKIQQLNQKAKDGIDNADRQLQEGKNGEARRQIAEVNQFGQQGIKAAENLSSVSETEAEPKNKNKQKKETKETKVNQQKESKLQELGMKNVELSEENKKVQEENKKVQEENKKLQKKYEEEQQAAYDKIQEKYVKQTLIPIKQKYEDLKQYRGYTVDKKLKKNQNYKENLINAGESLQKEINVNAEDLKKQFDLLKDPQQRKKLKNEFVQHVKELVSVRTDEDEKIPKIQEDEAEHIKTIHIPTINVNKNKPEHDVKIRLDFNPLLSAIPDEQEEIQGKKKRNVDEYENHEYFKDGMTLEDLLEFVKRILNNVEDDYQITVVDDNTTKVPDYDQNNIFIFFRHSPSKKILHCTVAVSTRSERTIYYFDPLSNRDRIELDKKYLEKFAKQSHVHLKLKTNEFQKQCGENWQDDDNYCCIYSLIFLQNILYGEDYLHAIDWNIDDQKLLEEYKHTAPKHYNYI